MTNKKPFRSLLNFFWLAVAIVFLAGCTPPGPRALLAGKRLLDQGEYGAAVEKLKLATSLLQTNAQAWNYLGLALHHAGQPVEAVDAYRKALKIDHNLFAVHYNLGCLLLEQNKPEAARDELTAFTLNQGNSLDGRLKLGAAQMRLAEFAMAERTFNDVLHMSPDNVEALNNLGVMRLQQRRSREAVPYFNAALKLRPDYGPALLNLAVVYHSYLIDRPQALQKYREYLALNPHPANYEAVSATARQLDLELNPPPVVTRVTPTNPVTPVAVAAEISKPATNPPGRPGSTELVATKTEPVTSRVAPPPPGRSTSPADPAIRPEVVQVAEAPVVRTAADAASTPQNSTADDDALLNTTPEKKGFFQRLNPANIFRRDPKPTTIVTPLPGSAAAQPDASREPAPATNPNSTAATTASAARQRAPVSMPPRYAYLNPPRPAPGNRTEAQTQFAAGYEAQRDHRTDAAVTAYRAATQADPSFFEAQSNLGLAAYDAGNLPLALSAYETALAITPNSFNARYNFALALRKANYVINAAEEGERMLKINASETAPHLAAVHLMLGSLYSEQFHQPQSARTHYQKVLELDPQNPNATAIRYWLRDNP